MTREPIYAALFALLSDIPGVVLSSRRLRHWTDVPPEEQPALFVTQGNEQADTLTGQPTKWLLSVDVYIYANTANGSPSTILNPIIDSVVDALMPITGNIQTLGGLVSYCRVSGQIETDEGLLGDQAVAIIPIEILAT